MGHFGQNWSFLVNIAILTHSGKRPQISGSILGGKRPNLGPIFEPLFTPFYPF